LSEPRKGIDLRHPGGLSVTNVAFSPDSKRLATADLSGKLRVWDLANSVITQEQQAGQDQLVAVAYSQDGSLLATAGSNKTIKIWQGDSGDKLKELWTLYGHTAPASSLAFHPEEAIVVSASSDRTVRFWRLRPEDLKERARQLLRREWTPT